MSSNSVVYTDGGVTYTLTPDSGSPWYDPLNLSHSLTISYADGTPSQTVLNVGVLTGQVSFTLGTLVNGLNFSNYFVPPGTVTTVLFGASLLSSPTFYIGGDVTIGSAISLLSGVTYNVIGNSAILHVGAGLVQGLSGTTVNLFQGGSYEVGFGLLSLLNGTSVNFDPNGSGGTFIFDGGNDLINFTTHNSLINLSGMNIQNFAASAGDRIEFRNVEGGITSYVVENNYFLGISTDSQTINLYDGSHKVCGIQIGGNALPVGTYTFGQPGPLAMQTQLESGKVDVFIDPTGGVLSHENQTIVSSQSITGIGQAISGDTLSLAGGNTLTVGNQNGLESVNNSATDVINLGAGAALIDQGGLDNSTNGTISIASAATISVGSSDLFNAINNSSRGVIIGGTGDEITDAGGLNNSTYGTISLAGGGSLSVSSNDPLNAINNSTHGTIIAGSGEQITDIGGLDNSTFGIISLAGNGTLSVGSTDKFNAINNSTYGNIIGGSGEQITDAGGLNNSTLGTISLAGNGSFSVASTDLFNAINNSSWGNITAGAGEQFTDAGGFNNSALGTLSLNDATASINGAFNNSANGLVNIDNNSSLTAGSFYGGNGTIAFQGTGNELSLTANSAPGYSNLGTITGFVAGNEINLTGTTYDQGDSIVSNGSVVSVIDNGTTIVSFTTIAGETFGIAGGVNGDIEITCFLAGTHIATPKGEVEVQNLRAGDMVLTANGTAKPVRWLGRSTISARFADPLRAAPIRITAGALGENLPVRDLLVSPAHAMFINGVLVDAGAMVNGTTILRETMSEETFIYYHVELEAHELILAEGAASESFIDNVDRMNFDNWSEHNTAEPSMPMVEMTYPRAKSGRQVPQAVRQQLGERAGLLNTMVNAA